MIKTGKSRLLVFLVVLVCAVGMTVLPVMASAGNPGGESDRSPARSTDNSAPGSIPVPENRPYFNLEAAQSMPGVAEEIEKLKENTPEELLPTSLLPEEEGEAASPQEAPPAGEGVADWIISRTNSTDTDWSTYDYDLWTGNTVIDNSGNMHLIFGIGRQNQDVGEGNLRTLYNYYHVQGKDGAWSEPVLVTKADSSKKETCALQGFSIDAAGRLHVLYSTHGWAKVTDPGWTDYRSKDENLAYTYRSPEGKWSGPRKLTTFSGNYEITALAPGIIGGEFHVAWFERANQCTATDWAYTTKVSYIEGSLDSWSKVKTLKDYKHADGNDSEPFPFGWPDVAVCGLKGEVTVTYEVDSLDPGKNKDAIVGAVKAAKGDWTGPENISSYTDN
ncbi:MAG: hypothetical protein L6427_12465, partial [Actinomycetia bacterium]|nr:hypothetical protein [Actinomycetes bacterium]